ncbi:MAG: hypothetical protein C5B48_05010 [Candidatus Rokuibacteriota bacterium]|nr:MAG: hypothetical protein C5B48_05010 [Candidatus Rokubacteria bacterium]
MSEGVPEPSAAKHLLREMDAAAREFYRRLSLDGRLATTRCRRCARTSFPPRTACSTCGDPLTWIELPRRGRLYAFTSQETALRFRAPAVLALAELGDVVVPGIAAAAHSELRIGQTVWVHALPEPETGLTLLSFTTTRIP